VAEVVKSMSEVNIAAGLMDYGAGNPGTDETRRLEPLYGPAH